MKGLLSRLDVRLAVLVFLAETLLLALLGTTVYLLCRSAFVDTFDADLVVDARTFAALATQGRLEGTAPGSGAGRRAAFYEVRAEGGRTLLRSPLSGEVPPWAAAASAKPVFGPLSLGGRPYRGVALAAGTGERRVLAFYADSTEELDEGLGTLREVLLMASGTLLLLCGPVAGLVAWRGLAPIRRLAAATDGIGEGTLDRRLDPAGLPADLRSPAEAVNRLLDRAGAAVERERRLAADAAHELRTPVATLKSGIQAALLFPADRAEDRRALEELLHDVTRLEALCESLLLSAVPSVPARTAREEFAAWVREAAGSAECSIPAAPAGGAPLLAEPMAARRIVSNLVENALLHGGPDPRARVALRWEASGAVVAVEDSGPGIPAADEARLFQRFFRADAARSRNTGGAGLGLAIARSLARAAGGDLVYERRAEGGSRFLWRVVAAPPE